jgi:hypothetical protein
MTPRILLLAGTLPNNYFQHLDWKLGCDNTGTCRAAGYHADGEDYCATFSLTRDAGANAEIHAQLRLADSDDATAAADHLHIGKRDLGIIVLDDKSTGTLSAQQTAALLEALPHDAPLTLTRDGTPWTVSTKGANAVLLKSTTFKEGRHARRAAAQKPEARVFGNRQSASTGHCRRAGCERSSGCPLDSRSAAGPTLGRIAKDDRIRRRGQLRRLQGHRIQRRRTSDVSSIQ